MRLRYREIGLVLPSAVSVAVLVAGLLAVAPRIVTSARANTLPHTLRLRLGHMRTHRYTDGTQDGSWGAAPCATGIPSGLSQIGVVGEVQDGFSQLAQGDVGNLFGSVVASGVGPMVFADERTSTGYRELWVEAWPGCRVAYWPFFGTG